MNAISRNTTRLGKWRLGATATLLGLAVAYPALGDDVSALAGQLATLRGEVEELAQKLNDKTNESRDALRSLGRQRSELDLELKREETRLQKLSSAIAKRREEIQAEKAKGDKLVPLFTEALGQVRAQVAEGLPFRSGERQDALNKLEEQYKAGLLTPARALSRLWSFVEDEFRMTRESGLFRQTVQLDGQDVLAEVVRVGTVMLFYKTDDGDVGKAVRAEGKWHFEPITGPDDKRLVLELFTTFKKQIRVGYFDLPGGLSAEQIEGAK